MPTYLEGIAAQFYRGIGPETQFIAPFSDMNFFVGANNAGKSVILNLIKDRLPFSDDGGRPLGQASAEAYKNKGAVHTGFTVAVARSIDRFRQDLQNARPSIRHLADEYGADPIYQIWALCQVHKHLWLPHADHHPNKAWLPNNASSVTGHLNRDSCVLLARELGVRLNNDMKTWGDLIMRGMLQLQEVRFPERHLIAAKRQIDGSNRQTDDLSGGTLIDDLAKLQNPDFKAYEDESRLFEKINNFLREVVGKSDVQLNVPAHKKHIQVQMDDKVLPLEALGTGIHEVVLMAAYCTIHQEKIMCIEEPEIHLHPVLQRKLIRYLKENTKNQYFIATHSAAFIDTPGASVFHVRNDGVQTYVTCAVKPGDKRKITDELGYRASDILQSNAVIWVEGPSDRIYIKHWLGAVNADLKEGIHYTIMFYGGGLISHLSADEDALDQFIRLRRLNQNMAIVIDSDREHSRASLKPAAKRLKEEMADADGLVWITQGREIENYVDADRLHDALKSLHPGIYGEPCGVGRYDHAFHFKRKQLRTGRNAIYKEADKVGVATLVCDGHADLSILDLKKQVTALAQMIEKAQGV